MARIGQAPFVLCRTALRLAVPVVAFFFLGNCGGDDPYETEPLSPPYQAMLEQVAGIRGLSAPANLRIGSISRDKLPGLLERSGESRPETGAGQSDTLYRLLGLLPSGSSYESASRSLLEGAAGAVYLPSRREVWLVRDGPLPHSPSALAPWEQRLLAHEFVHAIQDHHFNLLALERGAATTDARLALRALLEGDASWAESEWTAAALLPSLRDASLLEPSTQAKAPVAAIGREATFVYGSGKEWVTRLRAEDSASIDRLLRSGEALPTALILHPALQRSGWITSNPSLPVHPPTGGWSFDRSDTLGEFMLLNYLQTALPALTASSAAEGWTGDSASFYRSRTGQAALALRIRFRDEKDAGEFLAAHRGLLTNRRATVEEGATMATATRPDGVTVVQLTLTNREVTLVFADDRATAVELAGFLVSR